MDAGELLRFLEQGQHDLACAELSLRCDCRNLETVYVINRSGELAVTDNGDTFQYLDRSNDETYAAIDVDQAKAICHQHGVELEDREDERYPQVMQVVGDTSVRATIDAVAAAVDALFEAAMRRVPNTRPDS
jgi:ABC-type amino acid transport substrate-binding protein